MMKQWAFAIAIAALACSLANTAHIRLLGKGQTLVSEAILDNYQIDIEMVGIVNEIAHVIGHIADELKEEK